VHELGLRPYRVRLVWQVQSPVTGEWGSAEADGGLELELLPVLVKGIGGLDMVVEQAGRTDQGILSLSEISPAQVDEQTLLGWRDGSDWLAGNPRREFFYEVQQVSRGTGCSGDPAPKRRRMIPAGAPELVATSFEWRVRLVDQFGSRSAAGQDQTVPGGYVRTPARLIP